jgi:hypothetical protein
MFLNKYILRLHNYFNMTIIIKLIKCFFIPILYVTCIKTNYIFLNKSNPYNVSIKECII